MSNNQRLKIGLLAGSLSGAGAEKTLLTLGDFLTRKNCEVDLYLLQDKIDYQIPVNINIIILNEKHSFQKKRQLRALSKKINYDLFITGRADYFRYAAARNKYVSVHVTPYVWLTTENKSPLSSWLKLLRTRRKYQSKPLIALSQGIKDDLINNLGCKSENITVISNPFDFEKITAESLVTGPLPENGYIIYVASLIPRKRHKDLLLAFSRLQSDLDLVLVGKGPCENELKSLAADLNISDRVLFWGWDVNPYRLIRNARLSVLASEAEGSPRSLIESLLLGTPTISTDCQSGPGEILTGPFKEYLVPVGDIAALKDTMQHALRHYPDMKHLNLGRFSADHVAERYLNLIRKE